MSKHDDVVELTKRIQELEKEVRNMHLDLGRLHTHLITLLESDLDSESDEDTVEMFTDFHRCEKCGRMVEDRLMNTYLGVCLECLRETE